MTQEELSMVASLKVKIRQLEADLRARDVDHNNCYILMSENVRLRRVVEAKDDELREAIKQLSEERKKAKDAIHELDKLKKWIDITQAEKPRYS